MSNEPEFKVGDRVRRTKSAPAYPKGYEFTITKVDGEFLFDKFTIHYTENCEHVPPPTLADLITEKETLIADITKQLADAKAQLEALTAPKVGDIYHYRVRRGLTYKAVITSINEHRIGYDVTGCLPYHKEGPYAKPLNGFLAQYKKA